MDFVILAFHGEEAELFTLMLCTSFFLLTEVVVYHHYFSSVI